MEAYKTVFPKASDFKEVDGFSEEAASKIIAANENPIEGHDSDVISSAVEAVDASGEALGYIFNITTSKGYGGDIQLTVGIQSDGTVSGYSVLSISETAGLGMKAKDDPSWGKQFAGKKVEEAAEEVVEEEPVYTEPEEAVEEHGSHYWLSVQCL